MDSSPGALWRERSWNSVSCRQSHSVSHQEETLYTLECPQSCKQAGTLSYCDPVSRAETGIGAGYSEQQKLARGSHCLVRHYSAHLPKHTRQVWELGTLERMVLSQLQTPLLSGSGRPRLAEVPSVPLPCPSFPLTQQLQEHEGNSVPVCHLIASQVHAFKVTSAKGTLRATPLFQEEKPGMRGPPRHPTILGERVNIFMTTA